MNDDLKRPEMIRVLEEDLEYWKTGTYINEDYKYMGEPFTGFAVGGYYDNGNIEAEREYHNGEHIGWEVEYHENGKVAYETLMYGATSIIYNEYDEYGEKVDGGFVATKSLYNECARAIGIDEIEED